MRTEIEARTPHDAGWHWGDVCEMKDGKWFYSPPQHVTTEAEKAQMVDLSESDLPDPPPMP